MKYNPGSFISFNEKDEMHRKLETQMRKTYTNSQKVMIQTITFKITIIMNEAVNRLVKKGIYNSKSEFIRQAVTEKIVNNPNFMELIK